LVSATFIAALHLLEVSHLFARETAGAPLAKLSSLARRKAFNMGASGGGFRQVFPVGR